MQVWELPSGVLAARMQAHSSLASAVQYSRCGSLLVSVSDHGTICAWAAGALTAANDLWGGEVVRPVSALVLLVCVRECGRACACVHVRACVLQCIRATAPGYIAMD